MIPRRQFVRPAVNAGEVTANGDIVRISGGATMTSVGGARLIELIDSTLTRNEGRLTGVFDQGSVLDLGAGGLLRAEFTGLTMPAVTTPVLQPRSWTARSCRASAPTSSSWGASSSSRARVQPSRRPRRTP